MARPQSCLQFSLQEGFRSRGCRVWGFIGCRAWGFIGCRVWGFSCLVGVIGYIYIGYVVLGML